MAKGIDYAFSPHPSTTAIKAVGAKFVCRYVSSFAPNDHNGKNLLPAERTALLDAGLSIVIVSEEGSSRMKQGRAAGVADAQHADAVVKALGMPGLPVYFACDFDAAPGDQAAINNYLDGAASVIGRNRTGIYGGYYPVRRALDAGKAQFAWQTYAWSGGQWDSRAQLRQVKNGVKVGGASCDIDESRAADYGQWPRPGAVAVVTQPAKPAETSGPQPYPAPKALAVGAKRVSVELSWSQVLVSGKPVESYTVQAIGKNGHVYANVTASTNSVTLADLTGGWQYEIRVWANGGPVAPPHATLKITA